MSLGPFERYARDLAPGDRRVLGTSWDGFAVDVPAAGDALFDVAFDRLWREFGARGEMERREVIEDRMGWDPARPVCGLSLLYELLVVRRGERIVAVRDHTAITRAAGDVVVHLSHVVVEPELRGGGLASWLRAMPVETARRCASARGAEGRPITLVAEMEHDDGSPEAVARLRSYAGAGFRMIDPGCTAYCQPDFRAPGEIDRTGVRPVPLCLVVRRMGREQDETIDAAELRAIVDSLHAMFAVHVRSDHMAAVRARAASIPPAGTPVRLIAADATRPKGERA